MEDLDDYDLEVLPAFAPRYYQVETDEALERGWSEGLSRQLVVWATGAGKGSLAAMLAERTVKAGKKMLFLAHRESLIRQTAKRIADHGGVEVDIEMADERASPYASVVCASVQTLQSNERLTSFPDDHFDLIVCDESHRSLADGHQKVMGYFHYGAQSLADGWEPPLRGVSYEFRARIVGLTATPDIEGKKNLGDFYEKVAYTYDLLKAVEDGYLVKPISTSIPLKVDLRGIKASRTSHGSDISDQALSDRLVPYLKELAKQVAIMAADRKTVVFVPSVECARLMDGFLQAEGLNSSFVSGSCRDAMEKLERFKNAAPRGTVISNALYLTEGVDVPDLSCVVIFRATKARGFYCQLCGRASRPLPGLVDDLTTPEERRAAIAASAKPDFLILDPLWVSDRLRLCQPYDLVASDPRVADLMAKKAGNINDLAEMEAQAERDLMASLAIEARKHARKKARTIDPLNWATTINDPEIINYKPETPWDALPPDEKQTAYMEKRGLSAVQFRGLAQKVILRDLERDRLNLATPKQLVFLRKLGMSEAEVAKIKKGQAGAIIGHAAESWRK